MFATTAIGMSVIVFIVSTALIALGAVVTHYSFGETGISMIVIGAFIAAISGVIFLAANDIHNNYMAKINKNAARYCIINQKADNGFYDLESGKIICQHKHSFPIFEEKD